MIIKNADQRQGLDKAADWYHNFNFDDNCTLWLR